MIQIDRVRCPFRLLRDPVPGQCHKSLLSHSLSFFQRSLMSAPPPYEHNPDTRALPDGWITQFDNNYKAWFYVNTRASPPVTTWTHPLGPPPPPPQQQYAPPPNAPPNQGYATSYSPSPSPNQYGYNNNQAGVLRGPAAGWKGSPRRSLWETW
ncbi:hypothetical protein CPB84DRAFT_1168473 [Gymnopilus junonius]|uniref:WW domain-containing protein n=1 Tax=Gymnopilus junonius TaxID=109634 RepID=A0A9P5TLF5_GYMJU|nr:hypothetical protein CPB84DRAFT_1168473 [Gymnopilus junonius]